MGSTPGLVFIRFTSVFVTCDRFFWPERKSVSTGNFSISKNSADVHVDVVAKFEKTAAPANEVGAPLKLTPRYSELFKNNKKLSVSMRNLILRCF